uniref:Small ubiquitin-related modifier n=1 Tax=Brassica campestris TaxID=3711 RepID=A0A3P5Z8Y5_BRACM|nr:unnamed protein product [Brassica rapa]
MSATQEEDKKPGGDGGVHINLKVKGQIRIMLFPFSPWCFVFLQDGNEVFFRIKRSTQLKKLMNAYCDRQSVDMNAIAFLFDGRRLRAEQTPDELDMEDGDEIDAMLHQTGGCGDRTG